DPRGALLRHPLLLELLVLLLVLAARSFVRHLSHLLSRVVFLLPDLLVMKREESRAMLDDLERRIREVALSLPETYEDEPWGHPVFKVADNKMFASMTAGDGAVHLTV